MNAVFTFLETYEIALYVVLGLISLLFLRRLLLALREWRVSVFGLEKEAAHRRFSSALTVVILLALIGTGEFILVSFVAPVFSSAELITPTIDLLATSTATFPAGTFQAPMVISSEVTPDAQGCIAGQLEWTFPKAGEEVNGLVELMGTVNITNLGFYKFEFSQPGSSNWITIAAGNQKLVDQPLGGVWNTAQLVPGDYLLRLVATDNQNIAMTPCVIPVRVTTAP
jgi:hypothetical protein